MPWSPALCAGATACAGGSELRPSTGRVVGRASGAGQWGAARVGAARRPWRAEQGVGGAGAACRQGQAERSGARESGVPGACTRTGARVGTARGRCSRRAAGGRGTGRVEQGARGAGPGARGREERKGREGERKNGKKKRKRKKRGKKREKGVRERGIRAGIRAPIAEPVGHAWRPGARECDARVEEKQGAGYGCRVFGESGDLAEQGRFRKLGLGFQGGISSSTTKQNFSARFILGNFRGVTNLPHLK